MIGAQSVGSIDGAIPLGPADSRPSEAGAVDGAAEEAALGEAETVDDSAAGAVVAVVPQPATTRRNKPAWANVDRRIETPKISAIRQPSDARAGSS
ncbi:MAG TPA: hypothetical protein VIB99_07515 [Candidatus Limnocylindrales bacterium]|jgi:hypothetical protein